MSHDISFKLKIVHFLTFSLVFTLFPTLKLHIHITYQLQLWFQCITKGEMMTVKLWNLSKTQQNVLGKNYFVT